jgi:hypothetical protein
MLPFMTIFVIEEQFLNTMDLNYTYFLFFFFCNSDFFILRNMAEEGNVCLPLYPHTSDYVHPISVFTNSETAYCIFYITHSSVIQSWFKDLPSSRLQWTRVSKDGQSQSCSSFEANKC